MAHVYFNESSGDYLGKRWLKAGFTHCWVVVDDVVVHPGFHVTETAHAPGVEFECTASVSFALDEPEQRMLPVLRPQTCVETVKRVLGISNRTIFTPYQLYNYLRCHHG